MIEVGVMIDRMTIASPDVAALLARGRTRHLVLALVAAARTQAELSRQFGMSLNLLHHHLGRLEAAGLVAVTHREARRGRPVRHYRACARSFFVPADLAPPLPDPEMFRELHQALEQGRAGTYDGVLYDWDDGPRMRVMHNALATRPAADLWHRMRLSDADAAALVEDLRNLFDRYERRAGDQGRLFAILGAVAPLPGS